jgi:nucleotide-binding universal stress UspA family protein
MRLLTLKTVLVATDLDDKTSIPPLQSAHALAQAAGARLHVVHASTSLNVEGAVHATMDRAGLKPSNGTVHIVSAGAGDAAASIALLASEIRADVIVVGPHRQRRDTASTRTLGNTALMLVRRVSMPCMVVPRPLRLPLRRVVVAVDGSDTARGALLVGLSWASALRVQDHTANAATSLTALRIKESAESTERADPHASILEDELNRLRRHAGAWAGVTIESAAVASENVAAGIADYSNEHRAELVVLGTRGLGLNADDRLGSVSAAVTQQLSAPALLVPPAVWSNVST